MAEELLDGADVIAGDYQVGGEAVPGGEDGRQRLALGGDCDSAFLGEMGEVTVEVIAIEIPRVAAVERDVAADPGGVGLFGSEGVVTNSKLGTNPIQEAPGMPGRGPRKGLRGIHGSK
jgi:hypothetical protein